MKHAARNNAGRLDRPVKMTTPIPVRLTLRQEDELRQIKDCTGLPMSYIMRIGFDYFLPRFLSGEINILKIGRPR